MNAAQSFPATQRLVFRRFRAVAARFSSVYLQGGGRTAVGRVFLGLAAWAVGFWALEGCIAATAAGIAAEPAAAQGWHAQEYPRIRGVVSVRPTTQFAHSGKGSLELVVHLDGTTPVQREGEAFVDLRYHPPAGLDAPANLTGQLISAWLYAPPGLQGRASDPNGARLFVKDRAWHSEYGTWQHLSPGHWNRLTLVPSTVAPHLGFKSAGFSPRDVIVLGVSLAVGGRSNARFAGQAFLDDVSIGKTVAYNFEPAPSG